MITGPTGSGKTVLIRLLAAEMNLEIVELNADSCHSMNDVQDVINSCQSQTIESYFSQKKRLLWIDDVDLLCTHLVKFQSFFLNFLKDTTKQDKLQMHVICSNTTTAKVTDISKEFTVIKLNRPSCSDIYVFFSEFCESSNIPMNPEHLLEMIKTHKNDIRAIYMNLIESQNTNKNNPKQNDTVPSISTIRTTFQDSTIFEINEKILSVPHTLNTIDDLIYSDSKFIGWTIAENIGTELHYNRTIQPQEATRALVKILDSYAEAEVIDQYINVTMNWDLMPHMYCMMFGETMHQLHDIPRKSGTIGGKFIFNNVMNKMSQRSQFKRKKEDWNNKHNIDTDHIFLDGAEILANYLKTHVKNKKEQNHIIDKIDLDIGCRFGSDFGILTTSQCTSWKKMK